MRYRYIGKSAGQTVHEILGDQDHRRTRMRTVCSRSFDRKSLVLAPTEAVSCAVCIKTIEDEDNAKAFNEAAVEYLQAQEESALAGMSMEIYIWRDTLAWLRKTREDIDERIYELELNCPHLAAATTSFTAFGCARTVGSASCLICGVALGPCERHEAGFHEIRIARDPKPIVPAMVDRTWVNRDAYGNGVPCVHCGTKVLVG